MKARPEKRVLDVDGRVVRTMRQGVGGPVLYWGNAAQVAGEQEAGRTFTKARALVGDAPFMLVSYEMEDWDAAYSPWQVHVEARTAGKSSRVFMGKAGQTLDWLVGRCVPEIEGDAGVPSEQRFLVGYSLAGLFAVWALTQDRARGVFGGAASCSGSFWFPGWERYLEGARFAPGAKVFLSLGRKEEFVMDPLVSQVGKGNRELAQRLKSDSDVDAATFEWNDGGHFYDMEGRVARAVAWLVDHA